jgi:hypothetical protein
MKTAKRKARAKAAAHRPWVGLPPWELPPWPADAHKGRRASQSHDAAVRAVAFLSEQYRKNWRWRTGIVVEHRRIVEALNKKKVPFVLVGAYGIASWTGRPRSTHDVDILVRAGRNHARAVKAIRELYPMLMVVPLPGHTSFFVPGETQSVIDVTMPYRGDNEVTLTTGILIEDRGLTYRIPTLEAALANKYGAMLVPNRDPAKRLVDRADFFDMVRHSLDPGRTPIDLEKLRDLGEMVWPGGGGEEILRMVDEAKAGEMPDDPLKSRKTNGNKNGAK